MDKLSIEPGRALVLVGPQGCGKTGAARQAAAKVGTFVEVGPDALQSPFEMARALASRPATVIVDEVPGEFLRSQMARELVASPSIRVEYRGRPAKVVPAPNFIFCTGDVDAVRVAPEDRRFRVVRMTGEQR